MHAGAFGKTEVGRDSAEIGRNGCVVGILVRLVVYVKTSAPVCSVCRFVVTNMR